MTHVFKLPSGVEMEVSELTGKQQRIFTETNKKPHNEKLAEMLASIAVRVGETTVVTADWIKNKMLVCDRNYALVEARQFSLDFQEEFVFMHTYKDTLGKKQKIEISEKIDSGHFPMSALKKEEDGKLVDADYNSYDEIQRNIEIVLPRSGKKVRFTLLDGTGEATGIATKKDKRSSHTSIKMRNPVYFQPSKDENKPAIPVSLNLDSLSIKDIEYLRSRIKDFEGRVDTELLFENPETGKDEIIDVIGSVAFFFPSEAI